MRLILQRVKSGRVLVWEQPIAEIGKGLVILLGIGPGDGEDQVRTLTEKLANLRIFVDEQGKMNHSLLDVGGGGDCSVSVHFVCGYTQGQAAVLH